MLMLTLWCNLTLDETSQQGQIELKKFGKIKKERNKQTKKQRK
jgi:ribosomal protein RSM22 (predicted rRNA methylase)